MKILFQGDSITDAGRVREDETNMENATFVIKEKNTTNYITTSKKINKLLVNFFIYDTVLCVGMRQHVFFDVSNHVYGITSGYGKASL